MEDANLYNVRSVPSSTDAKATSLSNDQNAASGSSNFTSGSIDHKNKTVRLLTQRIVESVIDELNREEMKTRVQERIIVPLIHLVNQEETKKRVNDHIIGPLIKLMYSQMFPYLIVAAIILLSGLVMWVLMFTMFAMTYFRK